MFGVDWQNRYFIFCGQRSDQLTCYHQCFFIGQRNRFTCLYGSNGRFQAGISDHGRQYHVDRFRLNHLCNSIRTGPYLDRQVFERLFQFGVFLFVGNDYHFGHIFTCLINQQIYLIIGCQSVNVKQVGMFADHLQRLRSDRTGRT